MQKERYLERLISALWGKEDDANTPYQKGICAGEVLVLKDVLVSVFKMTWDEVNGIIAAEQEKIRKVEK